MLEVNHPAVSPAPGDGGFDGYAGTDRRTRALAEKNAAFCRRASWKGPALPIVPDDRRLLLDKRIGRRGHPDNSGRIRRFANLFIAIEVITKLIERPHPRRKAAMHHHDYVTTMNALTKPLPKAYLPL